MALAVLLASSACATVPSTSCTHQVAANTKGIALVKELIGEYGLPVVQAYMKHIQVGAGLLLALQQVCKLRAVDGE